MSAPGVKCKKCQTPILLFGADKRADKVRCPTCHRWVKVGGPWGKLPVGW